MNPIKDFDPVSIPKGDIVTGGINKNEQLVLYNGSVACLKLIFADKTIDYLPPAWTKSWRKNSPMSTIHYETFFKITVDSQPFSKLFGTVYELGEYVLDTNGPFQYALGVSVTNMSQVNNIGNAANTPIISVSQAGVPLNLYNFFADNTGNFQENWWDGNNLINLIRLFSGDVLNFLDGNVILGDYSAPISGQKTNVHVRGNFQVGDNSSASHYIPTNIYGDFSVLPVVRNYPTVGGSGSIDLYAMIMGSAKLYVLRGNNYQNNSIQTQVITFPDPFTKHQYFYVGRIDPAQSVSFYQSSVPQTVGVMTTLGATGGAVSLRTDIHIYSFGDCGTAIDSIGILPGGGANNWIIVLLGV